MRGEAESKLTSQYNAYIALHAELKTMYRFVILFGSLRFAGLFESNTRVSCWAWETSYSTWQPAVGWSCCLPTFSSCSDELS